MQTAATSVVSAAVIGGDLILGLGDGSIINCGRVQGPQGLKGDQGPMGATGRPGTDGNTIHTVAGAPDTTLGKDGDFAINTVVWEIYGPRSGGVWGTGTPLRGNKRGERESKDPIFGMGSDNGDGGGRAYNTANLPLAGTGRAHTAPGGNIIPIGNNLVFQSNLNRWIIDSLTALDEALPVSVGDVLPDDGEYQGDLFLKDGILYVYAKEGWIAVGGDAGPPVYVGEDEPPGTAQTGELWYCTDEKYLTLFVYTGTTWVEASPPVSLDDYVKTDDFEADQDRQDAEIKTIEFKLDALVGLQFKGVYTFKVDADCEAAYLACLAAAGGDMDAVQQCRREPVAVENGKVSSGTFEGVDPDGQFGPLTAIVIHKTAKGGEELEWESLVKAGDYLEIDHQGADGLDKQNYGLYRVAADPVEATNASGEAVYDIELEFLQGSGVLVAEDDYEVRGINQAEGVNPDELTMFLTKSGTQILDKAQWKLQQKDAGDNTRNFIEIHNSNMKLFHVQDCTDGSDAWAANKGYVDTQIAANKGTDYTLPTATTSTKGGVTSATNSGTYVPCTKMANTGSTIGVVQSTNTTQGVNYKGQACVTGNSTPNASDYKQGALVFSTSTNSLYIRT